MKKILAFMSMFLVIFTLAGCFNFTDTDDDKKPNVTDKVEYEITYASATLYKDSINTVWVNAIAEIKNTGNTNLYLSSGSMDLEDETGALVKVLNLVSVYPQIIAPGEKAYYYDSTTLSEVSETANLTLVLHPDVEKAKVSKMEFPVTDVVINDRDYFGVEAVGRVENTSSKDESFLYVVVVLFDNDNKPIAVLTALPDVKAGAKVGFTATELSLPRDLTKSSISRFEAFAYVRQFQF